MASQLGSIITNPEYAELLGITPALKPEQVKAVVIDDAPLDYKAFSLATKIIIGNYVKGSIYLSDDQTKLGRPEGFELSVRDVYVSAGAGFVVALTGAIMTMPGLPKKPAADNIDVDADGKITGLF